MLKKVLHACSIRDLILFRITLLFTILSKYVKNCIFPMIFSLIFKSYRSPSVLHDKVQQIVPIWKVVRHDRHIVGITNVGDYDAIDLFLSFFLKVASEYKLKRSFNSTQP